MRKISVGAFKVHVSKDDDMDVTEFVVPDSAEGPALVTIPVDGEATLFAVFIDTEEDGEKPESFKGLLHNVGV